MHRLQDLVRLHRMGVAERRAAKELRMGRNTARQYRRAIASAGMLDGCVDQLPELEQLKAAVNRAMPPRAPAQQTSSMVEWRERVESLLEKRLGPQAIYDRLRLEEVLYVAAQDLFKQLRASRADGTHDRRMLRFTTPDLLIIDDLGLRALRDEEPVELYEVIRSRYERCSTLITSNRTAPEIGELFGDPLLASTAMDRLLHDAHILVLEGASFWNPPGDRRKRKQDHQNHQEA